LNETERGSIPKNDIIARRIDVAKLIITQKARQGRFTISGMDFHARIVHIRFHRDYIHITLLSSTICERQAGASGSPTPLHFPMLHEIAYLVLAASRSKTDDSPVFSLLIQCISSPSMPMSDTYDHLARISATRQRNAMEIAIVVHKKFPARSKFRQLRDWRQENDLRFRRVIIRLVDSVMGGEDWKKRCDVAGKIRNAAEAKSPFLRKFPATGIARNRTCTF